MRIEEAKWLGEALSKIPMEEQSPLLDLGSSTLEFRTVRKPHIDNFFLAPLRARGVRIIHCDLREGEGIDISGDLYDPELRAKMKALNAKSLVCCNILEHVTNPAEFAAICDELLQPGGIMVVTAPQSYPLHPDPIDNYLRVAPSQLAALFPGYRVKDMTTIVSDSYMAELRRAPNAVGTLLKRLVRIAVFRGGVTATKARAHRLWWLFRPYKIAAVILQKDARPSVDRTVP